MANSKKIAKKIADLISKIEQLYQKAATLRGAEKQKCLQKAAKLEAKKASLCELLGAADATY